MMEPNASPEALTAVMRLTWELHTLTGKTCAEITRHVLATKTLRDLGQTGDGHLTQEQAKAGVRILERWIRQARERKE